MKHEILVGNIGRVYEGDVDEEALLTFLEYEAQSRTGYGRASGEPVTWLKAGEIHKEYIPPTEQARVCYKVWIEIEYIDETREVYETLDMDTASVATFKREKDAQKFAHALQVCGEEGLKRLMPAEVFYDE